MMESLRIAIPATITQCPECGEKREMVAQQLVELRQCPSCNYVYTISHTISIKTESHKIEGLKQ